MALATLRSLARRVRTLGRRPRSAEPLPEPAPAPVAPDPWANAKHRNAQGDLDFVEEQVPWIDRPDANVDRYVKSLKALPRDYDLRGQLEHWRKYGYVIFKQAASPRLIDIYLDDLNELYRNHSRYEISIRHEARGLVPIKDLTPEDLRHPHMRVLDFHNASVAGKKLVLNSQITSFLGHVFGEKVVAMQTLTFKQGSEQGVHQDFPYVVSYNASHLAASWVALEDAHPDAGPLAYYPGSHRVRKFDWGNGLFLNAESTYREEDFEAYLVKECERVGLKQQVFLPKKGDILIWHAALVHRGTPAKSRERTRLSLVSHFSSTSAYPRDRRMSHVVPKEYWLNGAVLYANPLRPQDEDLFRAGEAA